MTAPDSTTTARTRIAVAEEQLLSAFFVLCKTARLVEASNATFVNLLGNFMTAFRAVVGERPLLAIKNFEGHYFINEHMVRFDERGLTGAGEIVDEWHRLGIGGVHFDADLSPETAAGFFTAMAALRPDEHNIEMAAARLAALGLEQVELLSLEEVEENTPRLSEEERQRLRQMARTVFFRAMSNVRDVTAGIRDNQEINVARTKRVVHSLIDHIVRDEQSLVELTAIRDYDDYTFAHSTNVAVYALTVGVRLELDRARLSQLGFAALFHDIGKIKLPQDLVRKPDAFDENDWLQMQRHPLLGAKTILRNLKFDVHAARAARAAFEHHINSDFTGYPVLHYERRPPNLFSRIVTIVDTFDAMTSGRVYLKRAFAPDEAIKKMRYQMKAKFDTFLLKIFNDIIGVYPAGSLVLMTTDEIALILTNNDKEPLRPYVKIVGNRDGLLADPEWVDLSGPDQERRKVVRMIEPERYGLNAKDFILSD